MTTGCCIAFGFYVGPVDPGRALPDDFGELLLSALDPEDAEDAASLMFQAAALPDTALSAFLDRFAERVRSSPAPVRAAELRTWLESGG
jgi:hypothetical protein